MNSILDKEGGPFEVGPPAEAKSATKDLSCCRVMVVEGCRVFTRGVALQVLREVEDESG